MQPPSFQEMVVLALVEQFEPLTAYGLRKLIARAPNRNISSTPGTIYPIVARLKERGYISAAAIEDDRRNTEMLTTTPAGVAAITGWARTIDDTHVYPEDPLRTKIMSFHLLTLDEQLRWLDEAGAALASKLVELDEFRGRSPGEFFGMAYLNARLLTLARIEWIDRCRALIVGASKQDMHGHVK